MRETVKQLIAALRAGVPMLVRSDSGEALEAVIAATDRDRCCQVLEQALGQAAKPFGKRAALSGRAKSLADQLGGVWDGQCLFLSNLQEPAVGYASLWPWASDPAKITVKIGVLEG